MLSFDLCRLIVVRMGKLWQITWPVRRRQLYTCCRFDRNYKRQCTQFFRHSVCAFVCNRHLNPPTHHYKLFGACFGTWHWPHAFLFRAHATACVCTHIISVSVLCQFHLFINLLFHFWRWEVSRLNCMSQCMAASEGCHRSYCVCLVG